MLNTGKFKYKASQNLKSIQTYLVEEYDASDLVLMVDPDNENAIWQWDMNKYGDNAIGYHLDVTFQDNTGEIGIDTNGFPLLTWNNTWTTDPATIWSTWFWYNRGHFRGMEGGVDFAVTSAGINANNNIPTAPRMFKMSMDLFVTPGTIFGDGMLHGDASFEIYSTNPDIGTVVWGKYASNGAAGPATHASGIENLGLYINVTKNGSYDLQTNTIDICEAKLYAYAEE